VSPCPVPVCVLFRVGAVTFPERSGDSVGSVSDGAASRQAARAYGLRRSGLAAPAAALVVGGLVLALVVAAAPLAGLAHQSLDASDGSAPVWVSAGFGLVGFVVAGRRPGNPLGWVILAAAGLSALGEDAGFYGLADYGLRHGELPLGWVALLAQAAGRPSARYDADQMVAALAAQLKDEVDLDAVRDDLAAVVQQALEPAHLSVWISRRA
jgi:hypothetical protein